MIDVALVSENLSNSRCSLAETNIAAEVGEGGVDLNALVREIEGRMISKALKVTHGNKQAAARLLGLKRTTFSAKLRQYALIASGSNDKSA